MQSSSQSAPRTGRWHSLKSNPVTSAMMGVWGRHHVVKQVEGWIFCAATGRCGTNTLAEMVAVHPDVSAFHEPYPQPSFGILESRGTGDTATMANYWHREKFPRVTYAAQNSRAYLETSHLFIHTFANLAWESFGSRLKVIHLHRDVHQTARSFLQRGQDPANDPWLIQPSAQNIVLDIKDAVAPGAAFDSPYLRLVWYCHEIRAQAQDFQRRHPDTDLLNLATEDLNDRDVITRLLENLGLTAHEAVLDKCGQRYNTARAKPQAPPDLDAGQLSDFEALLADRYKAAGLTVPEMLN